MLRIHSLIIPLAAVLAQSSVWAQGSDDCATAQLIQVGDAIAFDTASATDSGPSNSSFTGPDLFFEFVYPADPELSIWIESAEPTAAFDIGFGCTVGSTDFYPINSPLALDDSSLVGLTFLLRVGSWSGLPYQGTLEFGYRCSQFPIQPDVFEENDTCQSSASIAAGTYVGVTTKYTDDDFYTITVPPGFRLDVDVQNVEGRTPRREFYDGVSCALLPMSPGQVGFDFFRNVTSTARDVIVRVYVNPTSFGGCSRYDLVVTLGPDPYLPLMDDILEGNDTLQTAVLVTPGTYVNLSVDAADRDFYAVDLNAGERLSVEFHSSEPIQTSFVDANGAAVSQSSCPKDLWVLENSTALPGRYRFEAVLASFGGPLCATYDMTISSIGSATPCSFPAIDSLEPNSAYCCYPSPVSFPVGDVVLGNGIFPDLTVGTLFSPETDAYHIYGTGTGDVTVTVEFDPAFGPVRMAAMNWKGCSSRARSVTVGGVSTITFGGGPLEVWCDPVPGSSCNRYVMTVDGARDPLPQYVTAAGYCGAAFPNSSGLPAQIRAVGRSSPRSYLPSTGAVLYVDQLPMGSFGYFLSGPTQGFVPTVMNSQGSLCLDGAIGRHLSFIFNAGPSGTASLNQNFGDMPTPTGIVSVPSGTSWNFQAWFRDANPGLTSNFTDGVNILLL